MVWGIPSPVKVLGQAVDFARSAEVLRRRGLIDLRRPEDMLRALLNANNFGPFATAVGHGAAVDGSAPAIVDERGEVNYTQLEELSNGLARGLGANGIKPGDVIAVLARDHRGLVLSMVAADKIGARIVLMNTGFAKPQFADVCAREGVSAILHDSEFTDLVSVLDSSIPRFLTWIDVTDKVDNTAKPIEYVIQGQSKAPVPAPKSKGGMVVLTSGTTGTPKGAPRQRISPLDIAQFVDRIPLPSNGTIVMGAPMFHTTGLSQFVIGLALGNKIVLQRRFNPETTIRNLVKTKASTLVLVPTMLQRIVDLGPRKLAKYDTSSLQLIVVAGSSLSPDLCRRTAAAFGNVLYNMYGSTEVAVATVATPSELRRAPGTVGRPPVGCQVALYDDDRNLIKTPNTLGTIFVSSGLSFTGYTDGRNKEIVDGLLSTGDVGHFDHERLWFVDGREDDMIVSGGENVYPLEVENLLAERPDITEAAVIGVDDHDFGKRLRAFVVAAKGSTKKDAEHIRDYVRDNLASFKVPRDVYFIDELPRNATGKILRSRLAEFTPPG
ncbi:acyl-CoA synthetase [Smaragdicoccus niigatensis]|uniref:acyl-CoA synthetase n=1 Tax=Smaragdicoccus niigatensis TaxID=359359 RepID=UPI00037165EE|nr:acyl-CoA synthetase [Smaragdicoccus niigatensis]